MVYKKKVDDIVNYLVDRDKILFLTTSNRWEGDRELPKSSILAGKIADRIGRDKVSIIDVSRLKIYPCEGNVSTHKGNNCGSKSAVLQDSLKNPSGCHRCWASINNPDDDLWQISKALFQSEVVVFFGSVRWGQMNSIYQKLIERLTWIENRHSSLEEDNVVKKIDAGLVCIGQNWNGKNILKTQKEVLKFFGFNIVDKLFLSWQYTSKKSDERLDSYKKTFHKFMKDFGLKE
jgi:multimeric flavodoxin WrbA